MCSFFFHELIIRTVPDKRKHSTVGEAWFRHLYSHLSLIQPNKLHSKPYSGRVYPCALGVHSVSAAPPACNSTICYTHSVYISWISVKYEQVALHLHVLQGNYAATSGSIAIPVWDAWGCTSSWWSQPRALLSCRSLWTPNFPPKPAE